MHAVCKPWESNRSDEVQFIRASFVSGVLQLPLPCRRWLLDSVAHLWTFIVKKSKSPNMPRNTTPVFSFGRCTGSAKSSKTPPMSCKCVASGRDPGQRSWTFSQRSWFRVFGPARRRDCETAMESAQSSSSEASRCATVLRVGTDGSLVRRSTGLRFGEQPTRERVY